MMLVHPGGSGVRSLTDAASRMGPVVASVSNDSDLMDGEDPLIPSGGTTPALSKPGGMDSCVLVSLTGSSGKSTLKDVLAVNNASAYIETMGVAEKSNKVPDGSEITKG